MILLFPSMQAYLWTTYLLLGKNRTPIPDLVASQNTLKECFLEDTVYKCTVQKVNQRPELSKSGFGTVISILFKYICYFTVPIMNILQCFIFQLLISSLFPYLSLCIYFLFSLNFIGNMICNASSIIFFKIDDIGFESLLPHVCASEWLVRVWETSCWSPYRKHSTTTGVKPSRCISWSWTAWGSESW